MIQVLKTDMGHIQVFVWLAFSAQLEECLFENLSSLEMQVMLAWRISNWDCG